MATISHDTASPREPAELGLGSAMIGATVFITAPLVAILASQIWAHGDRTPSVVLLHAWLARIAVIVPILLVSFGGRLAIGGLRKASGSGCSRCLPMCGLLLNLSALFVWILAAIALLNTTESMLSLAR